MLKQENLYLPSAVFIAQRLVGPSKQLKQIIQIEHNIVKNPNWSEANQLAIYKRGRGFELGTTEKKIQVVVRAGLEPGTDGLRVRRADHSATLRPFCSFVFWLPPFLTCLIHYDCFLYLTNLFNAVTDYPTSFKLYFVLTAVDLKTPMPLYF